MSIEQNNTSQSNNKRIAKNTMMLYIRMFISMAVSLYSSRVILQTVGVEDYGIYNVVGGVVGMFSFINATMSGATSRFLTFELGVGNKDKLKRTFSSAFWVHVIIATVVFVLCETIGLWFLNSKMVIPEKRMLAAQIVFQFSIISTMISIIQVPYNATLIAHEKMDVYAYVEMANVFLKLGILYILVIGNYDKLVLYGLLVLLVSTGVAIFYRYYVKNHFGECRVQFRWHPEVIKPMLSFSGWDFYGNMAVTARTQGVSMLINVFFGPLMNAAAGVAASVQGAVMGFANNITTAVRPQIIKYYAQGDYVSMGRLINNSCRLNSLILVLLMTPLCGEIDYVLRIWLGVVPDYASVFCILTLIFAALGNMSYLIVTGIHATGKIVRPSLINGSLYIMVIPVTYIAFKFGLPAWFSYLFNICAVVLGMLSNVYTLQLYVQEYSFRIFMREVVSRLILMFIFAVLIIYVIHSLMVPSFFRLIITCIVSTLFLCTFGWFVMLSQGMKQMIVNYLKNKLCKKG